MSQLQKYTHYPSRVIQLDDVKVRENVIVRASPLRLEDCEVKDLLGNEISLVKDV